jgi:ATP-dependent exoDNAse (exonuclease V) beta subunit
MNRPSDWKQRELGRDLQHSYIVQAPAGSGKTELLTQRMLGLLAYVENPEEVVAITFTRKAAAEMRNRLLGHLQAAAGPEDKTGELQEHELISRKLAHEVLENDKRQEWNLLEQPSRLRIRTIDSLCSELARQLPVLSGLGGGQQITVDAEALYRLAATRTMAIIEDESDPLQVDVIRVLDRYDNQYDKLVELLTGMLASREQWIGHLLDSRKADGFNRQGLEDALRFLVEIQLENARQITPDGLLSELPRFYHYALGNQADNEAALKALLDMCGGPECDFLDLPTTAQALPHWQTMIGSLVTAAGAMRKAAPNAKAGFPAPSLVKGAEKDRRKAWKDDFKDLLDTHRDNDALLGIFKIINTLPSPAYEDEAWESLESLMRILLRAAENWKVVMAETGEVDFGEIATRAIQSLGFEGAPSDLALRLDFRIQHLLVDEFQDTSASQVHLLKKLTTGWSDGDGHSLFLVGDPMQSIYRFRKAEVSLFIKAWQGELFDHIQLNPLQLSVNFRSTRPIVEWVNRIFPVVMPGNNDTVMGAVCYSEASTKPDVPANGTVAIKILPERDDEIEARQVIEVIGQCGQEESIAILVRSRSHASAILTKLDRLKQNPQTHNPGRYRYQAINFTPLAETTLIRDLVSLTLALIQPADRLAWLATLRAPYIGLNLSDLDGLVAGNASTIILEAINLEVINIHAAPDSAAGKICLSSDARQRLQRTGPTLLQAVNRRGRQSVRSLVESTWITLGGPACVENDSELDDATTYFDLLDTLEAENLPIDRDTLDLRLKNLYAEPDANANGNLQIITIYSAKGLQFDTVILPGLNRQPRGDEARLMHWFELPGEDSIVMSPMRNTAEKEKQKKSGDLIKFINNIEKKRQLLEDGRLLYVAATRAVHSLYLFAAIKPGTDGLIKPNASSLMGGLWPAIADDQAASIFEAAEALQAANEDQEGGEKKTEKDVAGRNLPQVYRRLGADWQLPAPAKSVQQVKTEIAETHNTIEFSWAGEDARLTGNLVHRLLQLIAEQGLESWQKNGGMAKHGNWCRLQLASDGVHKEKAETIITRASEAIANCLASEQGRWILENHEDAHCEYAITAVFNKQPKSLVLDRTFVDKGERWIIDYKTSSHGGGDLEGFLENEAKRYAGQLQRYKTAIAMTETRAIKTALYFPLLDRLLELD